MQLLLRTLILRLRAANTGAQIWANAVIPDVTAQAMAHIKIEHEVRQALKGGEIAAYLQPIVRLDDGVPIGFEALARWHHPRLGVLGPEALLPAVARAGLVEALDLLVVREAATMVGALNRRLTLAGRRPVFVAANFGAAHFADLRLAARLAEILEEAQLPAERLKIEITESTLISNPKAGEALAQLRNRGMSIHSAPSSKSTRSPKVLKTKRKPPCCAKWAASTARAISTAARCPPTKPVPPCSTAAEGAANSKACAELSRNN